MSDRRPSWSNLPLRWKGRVVVAIPLAALVVAVVALSVLWNEGRKAEASVRLSVSVQRAIQQVLAYTLSAESAVRGFLLTNDEQYLQPFEEARVLLPDSAARLADLAQGHPGQAALARRVGVLVTDRLAALSRLRSGGAALPVAVRDQLLSSGRLLTEEIRRRLDEMGVTEETLLQGKQRRQDDAQEGLRLTIWSSALVGLVGGVFAIALFTGGIVARTRRLEVNAERLAKGQAMEELPGGGDEIGRVAEALDRGASLLRDHGVELRSSEERFRLLAENSQDVIARTRLRPEPTVEYVSPAVSRMTGHTSEEFRDDPRLLQRIIHPEDRGLLAELISHPERLAEPHRVRLVRADGTTIWVESQAVVLRDDQGRPEIVQSATREITARVEAEQAARAMRKFMDSVIENIPHMVVVKSAEDLRFVRLNRAGEQLLGLSREELVGKNDFDFFPTEQAAFFTARDREVLESGRLVDIPEEPMQTRLRGTRLLHTKKIPLLGEGGAPQYLLSISEDITDRIEADRSLRRSEALKSSILAAIAEGTVITDGEGTIVSINPAMERLAGWTAEEVLGRPFAEAYPIFDARGAVKPWEKAVLHGAIAEREVISTRGFDQTLLTRDGRRVPYVGTASPLVDPDGGLLGGVELFRDVTFEKEVDQLKSSLVSTVSHELRTPLTMIRGFAELLLARDLKPERARGALEQIHMSAERLSRLIDDLLSVSRIESGRLVVRLEPVGLPETMRQVLATFPDPDRFELSLPQSGEAVLADRDMLVQILTNLASNAIKYSPPGSPVTIGAVHSGAAMEVEVRDRGIGMTENERASLFQKFYRADRPEVRDAGGTGLGLYITKNLVEMQGGQIWVRSTPGGGSSFHFSLPVAVAGGVREAS